VTLTGLRAALIAQGGTVAETLAPAGDADDHPAGPPQLAAAGPRAAGHEPEYELLLEMILEGSLLHYGSPRLVRCEDPDLALLLGDQLYALGLSRLAQLGDLDAVAELADLISLVAQAQAARDTALAAAIWDAGAAAIGWGGTPDHEAAKALARAGDDRARPALARAREAILAGAGAREGK
jgi:hypothetical protein